MFSFLLNVHRLIYWSEFLSVAFINHVSAHTSLVQKSNLIISLPLQISILYHRDSRNDLKLI